MEHAFQNRVDSYIDRPRGPFQAGCPILLDPVFTRAGIELPERP